jgi:hypothetical protein
LVLLRHVAGRARQPAQSQGRPGNLICGTDCKPYKMLKDTIDGTATY